MTFVLEKKVDSISDRLSLKGKQSLKRDYCPVYIFGKYHEAPFVMFGINPGYSYMNSPIEENEARKSWDRYQNLYLNFLDFSLKKDLNLPTTLCSCSFFQDSPETKTTI